MKVKMFVSRLKPWRDVPDPSEVENDINAWLARMGGRVTVHSLLMTPVKGMGDELWIFTTALYSRDGPNAPDAL